MNQYEVDLSGLTKRKNPKNDNAKIGAGMNAGISYETDGGDCDLNNCDRPAIENEVLKLYWRNMTVPLISEWSFFSGVGFALLVIVENTIFGFLCLYAAYMFGGISGTNIFTRACIVFGACLFVKSAIGRWTSATLDPIHTIAITVSFILTRGKNMSKGQYWYEIFKALLFIVMQWLGWMIALALLGVVTDTAIKTDDCTVLPTPAVCSVYPIRSPGITRTNAAWVSGLASMMIYGSYVWGERYLGWRFPGNLESGIYYAGSYWTWIMLGTVATGGAFNFWFGTMTLWFSGISDPDSDILFWPQMIGVFIVAFFDIISFYIINWINSRPTSPSIV